MPYRCHHGPFWRMYLEFESKQKARIIPSTAVLELFELSELEVLVIMVIRLGQLGLSGSNKLIQVVSVFSTIIRSAIIRLFLGLLIKVIFIRYCTHVGIWLSHGAWKVHW